MQRFIDAIVRGEKRPHEKESTLTKDNVSMLPASSSTGNRYCCNSNHSATNEAITSQVLLERIGHRSRITNNDDSSCCEEAYYSSEDKGISHIRQSETWDCGLACLQMIFQWLRTGDEERTSGTTTSSSSSSLSLEAEKAWMIKYVRTKSIWTIDLVMLLEYYSHNMTLEDDSDSVHHKQKVSYLFCSTKFGVDESYNKLGYYKDSFSSDELRVKRLFARALAYESNWSLLQTSQHVTLHTFVDVVSKQGVVAIVLLDNRVLKGNSILQQQTGRSSYSGHYVIVCGVSHNKNEVNYAQMNSPNNNIDCDRRQYDYCLVIKNPGIAKEVQFITPSIFEKAWRAKGTDEDVIFIKRHNNPVL